jgi:hypothetical protein
MEVNKYNSLQYNAMFAGTYLGIFYILKFPLFPLGLRYPIFFLVFGLLSVAVPFLSYYYAKTFRDKVCGGTISFVTSWIFLLLMYVFAALLVAVVHYIYFRYIDDGYIVNFYTSAIEMMKDNPVFPKEYQSQFKVVIDQMSSLTPIKIVFQLISQNVIYGNILALVVALFVMKRPK